MFELIKKKLKTMKERSDAENYGISEFVRFVSKEVSPNSIILDAGAGWCPYKGYFQHANYISLDFGSAFGTSPIGIIGDLTSIPFKDESIDAVLCTQVLEHVKEPKSVVSEFYRILKPNGSLFLTAPQGWGIHQEPYDYFRFTSYGLEYIFNSVGFNIEFIKPRGGYFWYIGSRLREICLFPKNIVIKKLLYVLFSLVNPTYVFISISTIKKSVGR
ncbi:MAG: class I SAM-dependent methyltransferase [Methanocellales archaeon]|nr:class I SAM-dependent methyltransferase [Methanocellales archaeon]